MEQVLASFSQTHQIISYIIIFFSIFIEGAVVTLLAGVLSAKHYLDIKDVIIAAFSASVIHDFLFWYLGRNIQRLKTTRFANTVEKAEGFIGKLKIHKGFYILASKFSWGLNRAVLTSAGMMKMPLKSFLAYSIPSCLLWSITIAYLGNIFSAKVDILSKNLKTAGLFMLLLIIGFVVIENLIRNFFERKYSSNNAAHQDD